MGKRPRDTEQTTRGTKRPKQDQEYTLTIIGPKPQRGEDIKDDTGPRLGWAEVKWGRLPTG